MKIKEKNVVEAPLIWFPVHQDKREDYLTLLTKFKEHNFFIHPSLYINKEDELPLIAVSIEENEGENFNETKVILGPTKPSFNGAWLNKFHHAISVKTLLKYFDKILIEKDKDFFIHLLNRDTIDL